jgi:hypothetical protein
MNHARHDRLLAALIAKLPAKTTPWPRADRAAWLRMMAMAFDVVYGPGGGICVVVDDARGDGGGAGAMHDALLQQPAEHSAATQALPGVAPPDFALPRRAQRFYVDRDGFAMGDGRPVAMDDLPAGVILWDERVGLECGDASAILWRDVGTSRRSLPPGVTLRPVFDES